MKTHYNTTQETGQLLMSFEQSNQRQNDKILAFFKENKYIGFTPEQIHKLLFNDNTPLTSVRRGITTLEKAFNLEKMEYVKGVSMYNRPTNVWCYGDNCL